MFVIAPAARRRGAPGRARRPPAGRGQEVVDLAALARGSRGSPAVPAVAATCCSCAHDAGFLPDVAFETEDYVAVMGLVAEGLGVALIPDLILRTAHHSDVVTAADHAGLAPARSTR